MEDIVTVYLDQCFELILKLDIRCVTQQLVVKFQHVLLSDNTDFWVEGGVCQGSAFQPHSVALAEESLFIN